MNSTPVLFIIFNRPDVTELVFNEIKKARPSHLFVAADGARANKPNDKTLCEKARAIVQKIDWPCELKTLYRDENLGCGHAVSSAISWFFDHVEEGIILEDDCLPHPDFFTFCSELLAYYRNDTKVMHIGGVNFQKGNIRSNASYYFSAVSHVWGWATWKRAWKLYDFNVSDFYTFVRKNKIKNYFSNEKLALHWLENFKSMYYHKVDTWDHQWSYTVLNNSALSIIPNTNLISNIGFREDATHTSSAGSIYANAKTTSILFPLKHPSIVELDAKADLFFFKDVDGLPISEGSFIYTFRQKIRTFLSRTIEYVLRHYVFSSIFKNPNKNIIIQKVDAVGDYIITRNFLKELVTDEKYKTYSIYLLANIRLKTFIEESDKQLFKEVIYFDVKDLARIKTKYGFYYKIRRLKADTIIHASFSRSVISDDIVFHSGAKHRIGYTGDTSNISAGNKTLTDTYYTRLIDVDKINKNPYSHEFEKQKTFFETLLDKKIAISKPSIEISQANSQDIKVYICPGAQEPRRIWSEEHFAKVINLLHKKFSVIKICIICAPNEEYLGVNILKFCEKKDNIQQINVSSIYDLCKELNEASLVLGNDSAPIHIAVAQNKKTVCISNGNHYKRFVPYPLSMYENLKVVLPPAFNDTNIHSQEFTSFYYSNPSYLNINEIEPNSVFNVCEKFLTQKS